MSVETTASPGYRCKVRPTVTDCQPHDIKNGTEDLVQTVTEDRKDEISRLTDEHRALKARIRELDKHISLTSAERVERAQLKKMKLRTKEQLLLLKQN